MADSGTKDFGKILSDGLYRIPNYQRGYAWTSDEVNDLLDDLEYVTNNDHVTDHYLNSIIVTEIEGGTLTDAVHIIDGQQRLLTANLLANEILRVAWQLVSESDEDSDLEHLRGQIDRKLTTDVFRRGATDAQWRILPADEHQSIFKELVPKDLLSDYTADRDLSKIREEVKENDSTPSEEKLVEAAETINRRLYDLLSSRDADTLQDELIYLDRLAKTLHEDFTATLHEVDSASEAGRIFEAINDRGRSLNTADKIKSYLVYRATLGDLSIDVTTIHETFTTIYETLNDYTSEPGQVDRLADRLIAQHWIMFAGEDDVTNSDDLVGRHKEATKNINQIKYAKYHAPKEGDDERVSRWIEVYLESLEAAAEAYVEIRGQDQVELFNHLKDRLSSSVDKDAVRHDLYAIETFGRSTLHALLIAAHIRFVDGESFASIADAIERFVIRTFGVSGARRDYKRNDLESLARVLFWKGRDDLMDVFPERSSIPESVEKDADKYNIDGSESDAASIINHLKRWGHNYSHETEDGEEIDLFEQRLAEDNLDGLAVAGWGGLTSSELKNYMLYQYEKEIRRGGADLPKYLDAGIYDYTVEHVWPDSRSNGEIAPELDDDEYARYVDRIGNLAFLSLSENSTAGNHSYEQKWRSTYSDARDGTTMISKEFPDPNGERTNLATEEGFKTWKTEVIEWRSKRMAKTLAKHWSCRD